VTSGQRWDLEAIRAGISVCLITAIPLTVIAAIVDSDSNGLNAFFFFGAMFGFILGGGCAAWVQRTGTPISHGMVATLVAYVGAQTIFIIVELATGDSVNWFGVFFTLSIVALAGAIGGLLASYLHGRGMYPSRRAS
jgi:hypothetical protein